MVSPSISHLTPQRKEVRAVSNNNYNGRIGNHGSQKVEAPFGQKTKAKGSVIKNKEKEDQIR